MASLVSEIAQRAKDMPDKPAFIFVSKDSSRTVLTFGDIERLGGKFAAVLHAKGISAGDVVCNTLANSPERLITQIGTLMAGAIDMNGQVCLADGADFLSSLNDGKAKAVIYNPQDEKGASKILKDKMQRGEGEELVCADVPSLRLTIPCKLKTDEVGSRALLEDLEDEAESACVDSGPDAVCAYMCTSGSTGFFKLVSFTGQFLVDWGHQFCRVLDVTRDSVYMNDRPLGWLGGYPSIVFVLGCTRVVLDGTVPRSEAYASFYWDVVKREQVTAAYMVPFLFSNLVGVVREHQKQQQQQQQQQQHVDGYLLRSAGVGSGPINKKVLEAIGTVTESIATVYASTEAGVMAMMWLTKPDDEDFADFVCGYPTSETEIKIVEESTEEELPAGQVGEILVRTSLLCSGYLNNAKANTDTFLAGGWVKLGDRGFLDSAGRLSVLGRGKHAIMRGSFIVYPEQLEFRVRQCPGLAEVAITGVPDAARHEEICALLVRDTTPTQQGVASGVSGITQGAESGVGGTVQEAESDVGGTEREAASGISEAEVRQFLRERLFIKTDNVDAIPMPKHIYFVEALPTFSNGKLDRASCKTLAKRMVCGGEA